MNASSGPEHRGTFRTTFALSLAIHVVFTLIVGSLLSEIAGGGRGSDEPSFVVSLFDAPEGVADDKEVGSTDVPEPDPVDPSPPEDPVVEDPVEMPPAEPTPKPLGAGSVTEGGGDPGLDSEDGEPAPLPSVGKPAPRFQPPKIQTLAMPIDPADFDDLDVPSEIPVRLRVGKDGRVLEIVPVDPDLPSPVLRALERSAQVMRFTPARIGDEPVEAWFSMKFRQRR